MQKYSTNIINCLYTAFKCCVLFVFMIGKRWCVTLKKKKKQQWFYLQDLKEKNTYYFLVEINGK